MNLNTPVGGRVFTMPLLLFTAIGVRLMLVPLHVDRLPIIDSWLKPICIAAGSVAGLISFILAVYYLWIKMPPNKLRRSHPALWSLTAAMTAAICGATGSWVTVGLLGAGAQYLSGKSAIMMATITRLDPPSFPRSPCEEHLYVQRNGGDEAIHMCLYSQFLHSLAAGVLKPGQPVKIQFRETPLGDVVESIEPAT
jgi:hypothetical protein